MPKCIVEGGDCVFNVDAVVEYLEFLTLLVLVFADKLDLLSVFASFDEPLEFLRDVVSNLIFLCSTRCYVVALSTEVENRTGGRVVCDRLRNVDDVIAQVLEIRSSRKLFAELRFVKRRNALRKDGHEVVILVDVEHWPSLLTEFV